jgi:DNA-binding NtrC family response regulator
MSLTLQAKLLRSLEQRQVRPVGGGRFVDVDVRIIAATNVDLREAVVAGDFREDLFYRLNVVHLKLPPLRERKEDLPLLAGHFLSEASSSANKPPPPIKPLAWSTMERYDWPGNIRQLRNVMHRVVALDDDGEIDRSDLPEEVGRGRRSGRRRTATALPVRSRTTRWPRSWPCRSSWWSTWRISWSLTGET